MPVPIGSGAVAYNADPGKPYVPGGQNPGLAAIAAANQPGAVTQDRPIVALEPRAVAAGAALSLSFHRPKGARSLVLYIRQTTNSITADICIVRCPIGATGEYWTMADMQATPGGVTGVRGVFRIGGVSGPDNWGAGASLDSGADAAEYNAHFGPVAAKCFQGLLPDDFTVEYRQGGSNPGTLFGMWLYGD
jgi:hypothetical protein